MLFNHVVYGVPKIRREMRNVIIKREEKNGGSECIKQIRQDTER